MGEECTSIEDYCYSDYEQDSVDENYGDLEAESQMILPKRPSTKVFYVFITLVLMKLWFLLHWFLDFLDDCVNSGLVLVGFVIGGIGVMGCVKFGIWCDLRRFIGFWRIDFWGV